MPRIDNFNFSGGQNSKASPLLLKESECELVLNYHGDTTGALTKRNGIVNLIGQIVDTKPILGMYMFYDIQGTDRSNLLIATDDSTSTNSDVFAIESNAWAISKTDDTAGATPEFATFIDYVFKVNGNQVMGSSADPRPTGGSWGTTNCATVITPRYIAIYEDRVYLANDRNTPYPSRLYWSSLPSGTPLALTWTTASDYADINPDDNDQITWISTHGNRLLVFKEKGLYRWSFGQTEPDKIIDIGTPQGRTVKYIHGITFFANQFGVWAYTGGFPKLISRKVQPFIDAIPTLANMRAEVDNDHYYLYIGDVTVTINNETRTFSNSMLVYCLSMDSWYLYTFPFEITAMARLRTKTIGATALTDNIYIGDDDGFVYRFLSGTQDSLGTSARPVAGEIIFKEIPINFPEDSMLDDTIVCAIQATGSRASYRLDRDKDFRGKMGDLVKRINFFDLKKQKASTFQLKITDNSTTISVIEGYSINHNPKREKQTKDDSAIR